MTYGLDARPMDNLEVERGQGLPVCDQGVPGSGSSPLEEVAVPSTATLCVPTTSGIGQGRTTQTPSQ